MKAGDIVEIIKIKHNDPTYIKYIGSIGTIDYMSESKDDSYPLHIVFENGKSSYFARDEVLLYNDKLSKLKNKLLGEKNEL